MQRRTESPRHYLAGQKFGIPGVRFPFRPRPGVEGDETLVRDEMGRVIVGVEDMLRSLVLRRFPRAARDTVEEMLQRCRTSLWERSLPAFDTSRGASLSTYIYACVRRYLAQEARRYASRKCQMEARVTELADPITPGCDLGESIRVERIAADVIANPERYLTPRQVGVLRAFMTGPRGEEIKQLARRLGYRVPSSLSMILSRIRDRLADFAEGA